MKKLAGIVFVLALCVMVQAPFSHAETTTTTTTSSVSSLLETLKTLMAKVAELQAQLAVIKGDIKDALKDGLHEGMSDGDITKIQELLASDHDIYPEGKVTGYYGPLTKEALKRFQQRHNLTVTGEMNPETKKLLEEYMQERFGDKQPEGLLRAPGIWKKVHDRVCERENGGAWGLFCKDFKKGEHKQDGEKKCEDKMEKRDRHHGDMKKDNNDDNKDDDGDVEDGDDDNTDQGDGDNNDTHGMNDHKNCGQEDHMGSTTSMFRVEIAVRAHDTRISFTSGGKRLVAEASTSKEADVLAAVADKLDKEVSELDSKLVAEIKATLKKALEHKTPEQSVKKTSAQNAIDDAQDAIDEAQNDIDDAESGVDTGDAEDLLSDAEQLLADAQDAQDAGEYLSAKEKANKAKNKAHDAQDAL